MECLGFVGRAADDEDDEEEKTTNARDKMQPREGCNLNWSLCERQRARDKSQIARPDADDAIIRTRLR